MTGDVTTSLAQSCCDEIRQVCAQLDESALAPALAEIAQARRICAYGVGREGLMMRALTMRLFHLGLDAHVIGDMTTPPVAAGDLVLVSAGPGHFSTVHALIDTAHAAGARVLCVTAQPGTDCPQKADARLVIPAQTMADDTAGPSSTLPMGSLYEGAQYVTFEVLILRLMDRLGIGFADMRARHTNLE